MHPLDNPIWQALTTTQARFSEGNLLAKRYPLDIVPFAAVAEASERAFLALQQIIEPSMVLALFRPEPWEQRQGWELLQSFKAVQMVCQDLPRKPKQLAESLGPSDLPQMQALVETTKPGPFKPQAIQLGHYIGLWDKGVLVAMAGERMRLEGYTEVSAVCTHPDHQGQGFAGVLVAQLCQEIVARGETPFLHVMGENARAIALYERIGFVQRSTMYVSVLRLDRGSARP